MALNFPSSPTSGQTYSSGGKTWTWDGSTWVGTQPFDTPVATSSSKGTVELFSDTVQSVAANTVTATAGKTYGIQLNSAGQMVVNVPWIDTNTGTVTSITAGTGLSGGTITSSGTIALANTTVTAGNYTNATITVDAQGRITSASSGTIGVSSFNTRTGAVTLSSGDVTTALGYTPLSIAGGTMTGSITLSSAAPAIHWHETDQTLPAGRRRVVADGNSLRIDYNTATAGDYSTYTTHLSTDSSGNLTASGNVTAYSDERLKVDWQDLSTDFIKQLAKVKYGTYTRIDNNIRQVGVSAQSLQQVLPEAVQGGEYLSVAYGNAALAAVIELSKRVLELEDKLTKLQG